MQLDQLKDQTGPVSIRKAMVMGRIWKYNGDVSE